MDGSDGRTYILAYNGSYGMITVFRSDFMHEESVHRDTNEGSDRFNELKKIIESASGYLKTV